jgi:hypothetical protein
LRAIAAAKLLLLLCVLPARAACPDVYNAIRQEIFREFREDLSCEDVLAAARLLPIRTRSTSHQAVAFAGEIDLRRELNDAHGIRIPNDILLLGTIVRQPPSGPRILIAFGLDMPRRIEAFRRLAQLREPPAREALAAVIGDGVFYDRIGFYFEDKDGKLPVDGVWKPMRRGGLWKVHQRIPAKGLRVCRPCSGWLCPKAPLACFSDFNADGAEEVHITDDCPDGACGLAVLEPYPGEQVRTILSQTVEHARWKETAEGWVLMRAPICRAGSWRCGRGNPNCQRPQLFVIRRDGSKAVRSKKLESRLYPIRRRPWPRGCTARKGDAELVYSTRGGFVLYER